jgi:hypothetical protein
MTTINEAVKDIYLFISLWSLFIFSLVLGIHFSEINDTYSFICSIIIMLLLFVFICKEYIKHDKRKEAGENKKEKKE